MVRIVGTVQANKGRFDLGATSIGHQLRYTRADIKYMTLNATTEHNEDYRDTPVVRRLHSILSIVEDNFFCRTGRRVVILQTLVTSPRAASFVCSTLSVRARVASMIDARRRVKEVIQLRVQIRTIPLFILFIFIAMSGVYIQVLVRNLRCLGRYLKDRFVIVIGRASRLS